MWRGASGSQLCFQLGHTDRILPSQSQSVTRQLVSYILFNDIHTSHATQKPETRKKFWRTCGFLSNPGKPGSPRYCYENDV